MRVEYTKSEPQRLRLYGSLYLLYHLQQTLKRIKVSWVAIDIEQVAVVVDEPVGYPLPQRFIYQITFDFQRLRNSFRLTSPEAMLLPKELPSTDTA